MDAIMRKGNILDAFLSGRCPACSLLRQDEFDLLCHWVGVSDEKHRTSNERKKLLKSKGFCNYHFWAFERISGPYGSAEVGMELIEEIIDILQGEEGGNRFLGLLEHYRNLDCPLCADMGEIEAAYIKELISLLAFHDNRDKYAAGWGLCLPHLIQTVMQLKDDSIVSFLLETAKERLESVKSNAGDFIRKKAPPLRWEQTKDEENSGFRAIEKLVGRHGTEMLLE
jgi:hypothetical protein